MRYSRMWRAAVLFQMLAAAFAGSPLLADAVNPWVMSDADMFGTGPAPVAFSMETFHTSPPFANLRPLEFCYKLFDVYYDGRRKNYGEFDKGMTLWAHTSQEPRAAKDVIELDPIVLLNVHGTGYCGIQSGLLEGIYQSRPGGEPGKPAIEARRWFLGGIIHSICEAYFDGQWHYFDIDLGGYAGDQTNPVWSFPHVLKHRADYYLSTPLRSSYFFKADGNGNWVDRVDVAKSYCFQDNQMLGHEMTFALRKGETFTRYFSEKAAGWHEFPPYTRNLQEQQKGYWSLVYAPAPKDVAKDALFEQMGTRVYAVRCPYNISSSKVEASGKASYSLDLGRTWGMLEADGTAKGAANQWDYLLKVEGGELKRIESRGILHPGALPRVGTRQTTMTVKTMAPYRTLTWIPDMSSSQHLSKYATVKGLSHKANVPESFTGARLQGSGLVTFQVPAPPGGKLVKVSACVLGGTGTTPQSNNFLEVFIGPQGSPKLAGRSTDCTGWGTKPESKVDQGDNNVNGSAEFPETDKAEVTVKVNGWGFVSGVRIYAHYVPVNKPEAKGTLVITHGFDGKAVQQAVQIADLEKKPVSYSIPLGAKQNDYIKMEVK